MKPTAAFSASSALPSEGMPLNIRTSILIFAIYFLVQMPLQELAMYYTLEEFIAKYTSFKAILLISTTFIAFLGQAIGVYLVCYYTYKRYPIWLTFILSLLVWFCMTLFRYSFDQVIFHWLFGIQNYTNDPSLVFYFADNVYWGGNYCMFGVVIYFIQYAIFSERRRGELAVQKRTTELAFLRSQVNPHFLFNTLNNLYSLVYAKSENALKVVEKLSGLLRYSLYEVETTVPVQQEIKYLRDFIELERLRYDFPLALEFNIDDHLEGLQMPPFLFVPFVENAFKHGDLRDLEQPVEISVVRSTHELKTSREQERHARVENIARADSPALIFKCVNKIKAKQKDSVGGIGLENVRKRLELLYGNEYDLRIEQTEDIFAVELFIVLSK